MSLSKGKRGGSVAAPWREAQKQRVKSVCQRQKAKRLLCSQVDGSALNFPRYFSCDFEGTVETFGDARVVFSPLGFFLFGPRHVGGSACSYSGRFALQRNYACFDGDCARFSGHEPRCVHSAVDVYLRGVERRCVAPLYTPLPVGPACGRARGIDTAVRAFAWCKRSVSRPPTAGGFAAPLARVVGPRHRRHPAHRPTHLRRFAK